MPADPLTWSHGLAPLRILQALTACSWSLSEWIDATARAGNHHCWRLSGLRAHTKAPYKTGLLWTTLRALKRPERARAVVEECAAVLLRGAPGHRDVDHLPAAPRNQTAARNTGAILRCASFMEPAALTVYFGGDFSHKKGCATVAPELSFHLPVRPHL